MSSKLSTSQSLRVCMVGRFAFDYPRHQIIRTGLERVGITVQSVVLNPRGNTLSSTLELLRRRQELTDCDLIFIPAFNQLLAPFIKLLAVMLGKPVLLDYMIGLTDSVVEDRQQVNGLKALAFRAIDNFNLRTMLSITDTTSHVEIFKHIATTRNLKVIPVGVYDDWFAPQSPPINKPLLVQFFGSYIPFHGVDIILDTIKQFHGDSHVRFELIGSGQTYKQSREHAKQLGLDNVEFVSPIPPAELPARLAQADICLGVFGASTKTDYVVPNKVFQCMAIGRPVITAEATALHEFFVPGKHLITVTPGNSDELARAIRYLIESPEQRQKLGEAAAIRIQESFLPQHIGRMLKSLIADYL